MLEIMSLLSCSSFDLYCILSYYYFAMIELIKVDGYHKTITAMKTVKVWVYLIQFCTASSEKKRYVVNWYVTVVQDSRSFKAIEIGTNRKPYAISY